MVKNTRFLKTAFKSYYSSSLMFIPRAGRTLERKRPEINHYVVS
jgi:hypothetical protein